VPTIGKHVETLSNILVRDPNDHLDTTDVFLVSVTEICAVPQGSADFQRAGELCLREDRCTGYSVCELKFVRVSCVGVRPDLGDAPDMQIHFFVGLGESSFCMSAGARLCR
jgi:hypothetical protein